MRVGHGGCSLVDAGAAGGPRRGPKALSTTEKVQWQAIAWFRVPRVPRDLSAVGIRCDARAGPVSQRGDRLRWQARQCPAHEGQTAPETDREQIRSTSCRERGCMYVSNSVVHVAIKK